MTDFVRRPHWSVADKCAGIIAMILVTVNVFADQLGAADGWIAPVVSDFTMADVARDDGVIIVSGSFDIVRPKCSFRRVEWRIRKGDRDVPVDVDFREGPKVRPGGVNEFRDWAVAMTIDDLSDSYVTVFHACPWRPWLTKTQLYP